MNESSDYKLQIAELGLTEELFDEYMKIGDEFGGGGPECYVVKEGPEPSGFNLQELIRQLPVAEIRSKKGVEIDLQGICLEVNGEYFPDFIAVQGVYLVTRKLLEYLDAKSGRARQYAFNGVALVSAERHRTVEYYAFVPPELDCIVEGSEVYDMQRQLIYFEINPAKIKKHPFFKIKGYPHLISFF